MNTKTTRRRFLGRGLAAAGAAAAAPWLVPGSALGLSGAVAPSERINMGFVGLGGQGGGHLFGGAWTYLPGGYLGRDDVQVLGVCDVRHPVADGAKQRVEARYAEKFGAGNYRACTAYYDIRDLLLNDQIDAVLIAAAYHAAAANALLAVRAGKDVYCEKPTSATIQAGRALADAVRAYGRVYQGGTQQRSEYDGKFYQAVAMVRGGHIGKLQRVYSYQVGGAILSPPAGPDRMPIPPEVNWDAYVGPLPYFPFDGNTGAHRFGWGDINWGQHHYDIVQWGLGTDDTGPIEVRLEEGKPVLRFANGVEVFGTAPPGQGWCPGGACFVGTEGSITVHRDAIFSDPPHLVQRPLPRDVEGVYYSPSHSGNFLDCVRTRQQTICSAETTHRANSLLLLGGIAQRVGRSLKWDPVREVFPDDPEANRYLSLAAREGWCY